MLNGGSESLIDSWYNGKNIQKNNLPIYNYKNFELQKEKGIYYIFKNTTKGGARIGLIWKEDNKLFYYSSEGMAYTNNSLSELAEFLEYLEQFKDEFNSSN